MLAVGKYLHTPVLLFFLGRDCTYFNNAKLAHPNYCHVTVKAKLKIRLFLLSKDWIRTFMVTRKMWNGVIAGL
jgi:hypothetical protein